MKTDRFSTVSHDARPSPEVARVWDPFVRLFHWGLVTSFVVAWLTSHGSRATIHHWAGYAALSLIVVRVLWGVMGTTYARFAQFVHHPRTVLTYLAAIARGNEERYIGHNPAGGAMVIALMAMMTATVVSGWMTTTDRYFGVSWVETLHSLLAHGILALVLIHVGGVLLASYRHRENLVAAMISGRKRAAGQNDVA